MDELLPIGSVVSLKDKRRLMIIGYSPNTPLSENQYDYIGSNLSGISKPQEMLRYNKDYFYFNKKDIDMILYIGHVNNEFKLYKKVNEEINNAINKVKQEKGKIEEADIEKIYSEFINNIKSNGSDKNEK